MDSSSTGDAPTVKEACTLSCAKQAGPHECTFDPCKCTKAGDFCGSSLPAGGNYEKGLQYSAIMALPQKQKIACDTSMV